MARFAVVALINLAVAFVSAEDPEFCSTRAVPYTCLTPLFTPEILKKVAILKDVNLVAISRMEPAQIQEKIDALDVFCNPFIESTQCGKAGLWYECSRDIEAVTSLVNAVQDTVNGAEMTEWHMPADKIQMYMRYAGLVCDKATGLRQILSQKDCVVNSFANASEHFRNVQLNRLSNILASNDFKNRCIQAQSGVFDLMEVVEQGCSSDVSDYMFKFISSSFTIVPGYSVDACPINRTRSDSDFVDFDWGNETTSDLPVIDENGPEPDFCTAKTAAAKYRCFARNLKLDVLTKVESFESLDPISLTSLSESDITSRLDLVNSFCVFLNSTIECANQWWQCDADVRAVTKLINDMQELANGPGHEDWYVQPAWIKRHFKFAGYLCANDDLQRLYSNQECAKKGLKSVEPIVNRLGDILHSKKRFDASTQCESTKEDVKAVANAINDECKTVGFTENLLSAAFVLLDGYSDKTCAFLSESAGK